MNTNECHEEEEEEEEEEEFDSSIVIYEGEELLSHHWDSGGPGAGAGVDTLYEYKGKYYVSHDAGIDKFDDPMEAIFHHDLLGDTDATTSIQISPKLKKMMEGTKDG